MAEAASEALAFVVSGGRGALVRETAAADSEKVGVLPVHTDVRCVECCEVDGKIRVALEAPMTGWVSLKLLRVAEVPAPEGCRSLETPVIALDWFGRHYGGRFASASREALPPKTPSKPIHFLPRRQDATRTNLEEKGWNSISYPTPFFAPVNWRTLPVNVVEAVALSDQHTTVLVGGSDVNVAKHPAAMVARAGPSGPAFGRYDDEDRRRTPEQQRQADEEAFPSTCGSCKKNDVTRCLYAAVCSQHSSYSMSHYQWVVEYSETEFAPSRERPGTDVHRRYELYCLQCDLKGRPAYTARTNHTSHAMPAAQGYIARESAARGTE